MKDIEFFYNIAEKENIRIYKEYLGDLNGFCIDEKNDCRIYIDKRIENFLEEKLVLVHELGHYFKSVTPNAIFSNSYEDKLKRQRNEARAEKWTIQQLVPFEHLKSLLEKNLDDYEIADKLDVPVSIIKQAYTIYESKFLNL